MPSRSLYLAYGGDFALNARGGLAVAQDTPAEATSSIQRTQRLIFTNPQQKDQDGNVIARGDNLQHPEYGVGLATYVDATPTAATIAALKTSIVNQLAQDPGISQSPSPAATVERQGNESLTVSVTAKTSSGQVYTTPAYPLNTSTGG